MYLTYLLCHCRAFFAKLTHICTSYHKFSHQDIASCFVIPDNTVATGWTTWVRFPAGAGLPCFFVDPESWSWEHVRGKAARACCLPKLRLV